jgi:SAM-dependent methyltransferase
MNQTSTLRENLLALAQQSEQRDWLTGLEDRKRTELEFHNRDRDSDLTKDLPNDTFELLHANKKYYSTTELSRNYVESWLTREVKGKVFLDYACGNGQRAIEAAQKGAALSVGLDISDVSVRNARAAAEKAGVADRCIFLQGDCENTGIPDGTFDVAICTGMLHHLDLSFAFPELRRVLKPGGKVMAVEALDYNPFIKAYRWWTPTMRTEWEKNHILSLKDVTFARRFFAVEEIRYWHFLSIFCAYLPAESLLRVAALKMSNWMDRVVAKIPLLRLMAWQFTFVMVKR